MSILNNLLKLLFPYAGRMLGVVLLGFCTIGSNVGLMATSAYLISRAALHPPVLDLMVAIVGVRFFGISRAIFRYLERYFSHDVTFRILTRIRVWFYKNIEPLAPAGLVETRSGDLLNGIVADVEVLKNFYLRVIFPPFVAILVLILGMFLLGHFDKTLAAVLVLAFFLAGFIIPLGIKIVGRQVGQSLVQGKAKLNINLVDSLQGLTDVIAFGQKTSQLQKLEQASRELAYWQGWRANLTGISSALTSLCMHLAMWSILVLAIGLVNSGKVKGIYLAMLPLAALSSFEAVLPLPMIFPFLEETMAAAKRIFGMTDRRPAVQDPLVKEIISQRFCLVIENLQFRYMPTEPWLFKNVSFEVPQGQRLAVVGPSGAGKSSLVNLFLRFWDYQGGSIRLGGKELKQYSQEDLRKQIAVVSQRTHLFNATILENLLLACPRASELEVRQAAQRAKAHDFIQELPKGYDTYVGEGGYKLSGGQRQRLAIARALLKDAPILILDEATAGLDPALEREILTDIQQLMNGKTTIMITHRLVGLEEMDQILVLNNGKVDEIGSHEELINKFGYYRNMWQQWRETL